MAGLRRLRTSSRCPVCRSHRHKVHSSRADYEVTELKCQNCGAVFAPNGHKHTTSRGKPKPGAR